MTTGIKMTLTLEQHFYHTISQYMLMCIRTMIVQCNLCLNVSRACR